MKIDQLYKRGTNTGYPLNKRYPAKVIAKYEKDLRHVVARIEEGHAIPTIQDLREYFAGEYGIQVGVCALRNHLRSIKKGQPLWR